MAKKSLMKPSRLKKKSLSSVWNCIKTSFKFAGTKKGQTFNKFQIVMLFHSHLKTRKEILSKNLCMIVILIGTFFPKISDSVIYGLFDFLIPSLWKKPHKHIFVMTKIPHLKVYIFAIEILPNFCFFLPRKRKKSWKKTTKNGEGGEKFCSDINNEFLHRFIINFGFSPSISFRYSCQLFCDLWEKLPLIQKRVFFYEKNRKIFRSTSINAFKKPNFYRFISLSSLITRYKIPSKIMDIFPTKIPASIPR